MYIFNHKHFGLEIFQIVTSVKLFKHFRVYILIQIYQNQTRKFIYNYLSQNIAYCPQYTPPRTPTPLTLRKCILPTRTF